MRDLARYGLEHGWCGWQLSALIRANAPSGTPHRLSAPDLRCSAIWSESIG